MIGGLRNLLENKRKAQVFSYLRKIAIALGIAALFFILSLYPSLGYFGEADTSVRARDPMGFWLVYAKANMTYNPFLYSLTWLRGEGILTDRSFIFISYPVYVGGGEGSHPVWRTPQELEEEATIRLVLSQLYLNLIYNFAIVLVIEIGKLRSLYFCLIGGIIGFPIGGIGGIPFGATLGAVAGFVGGILSIIFVLPRLRNNSTLVKWWDSLWEREEIKV